MKSLLLLRNRHLVLLLALLLIGQATLFQARRIFQPSVSAFYVQMDNAVTDMGISITTLVDHPDGLRNEDVVLAIDDVSIEDWMANVLTHPFSQPTLRQGEIMRFMVQRGTSTMTVEQALTPYPLQRALAARLPSEISFHAFLLVAIFLFIKRPDERAAKVLLIIAVAQLTTNWGWGFQLTDIVSGTGFLHYLLSTTFVFALIWIGFLHFALSFPRPHRWQCQRRWLVPLIYVLPFLMIIAWWLISWQFQDSILDWYKTSIRPVFIIVPLYLLLTLIVVIIKFSHERDPVSQAQIRWVLFAVTLAWLVAVLIQVGAYLVTGTLQSGTTVFPFIGAGFLLVPIAVVVAILRYRLFDIDVIIRKTLQYGVLTAALALIYTGLIVLLQTLFQNTTGQQSPVIIVISTLAITALFNPLRHRVQHVIDRKFYRRHYDAEQVLAAFARTARDETDMDRLTDALLTVVKETMQPTEAGFWLVPHKQVLRGD